MGGSVLLWSILVFFLLVNTWIHNGGRLRHSCPFAGSCPLGRGTALANVTTLPFSKEEAFYFPCSLFKGEKLSLRVWFIFVVYCCLCVTKREPTLGYNDVHSVGTPKWAFWEKNGQKNCKSTLSPWYDVFFWSTKGRFSFSGELVMWMIHIGWARHAGPDSWCFPPGQLSIEFINVGGWLTSGDLAMDSCAQFLAVAEHRLIPSGARLIAHLLRRAGHQSV